MKVYEATEQAYKNGYEAGKRDALKWIPVTERLPKEWEDVLVLLRCGDYAVGVRSGHIWRVRWNNHALDYVPTHWMPLPEPPNCGADMRGAEDGN